jgi:hypothetical protein
MQRRIEGDVEEDCTCTERDGGEGWDVPWTFSKGVNEHFACASPILVLGWTEHRRRRQQQQQQQQYYTARRSRTHWGYGVQKRLCFAFFLHSHFPIYTI